MQTILQFLILVFVVPAILLLVLYASIQMTLVRLDYMSNARRAAALVLGFLLFVIFIVLNLFSNVLPSSTLSAYADAFSDPAGFLLGGFGAGLVLMATVDFLLAPLVAAILIMVLSSLSLTSLYLYISISESRSPVVLASVSFLAGILLYGVLRPDPIAKLKLYELLRRIFRGLGISRRRI